ncbi:MAG: ferrochelatase [Myxococcaceae bacterium]
MERVGVVLIHRGEAATPQDAGAFLRAFYSDPSAYPVPLWSEVQKLVARIRARAEQGEYEKEILQAGGRSPLHAAADSLAARLEDTLNGESKGTAAAGFSVKVAYRYCRPLAAEVIAALKADGIGRVVGVSLYPQLCPTFLGSSTAELSRAADAAELKLSVVDRYGEHPAYVEALKRTITSTLERFDPGERDKVTLLFSGLGLDPRPAGEGDPYPAQVKATVKVLMAGLPNPHRVAFHGKDSIGPYTLQMLQQLAQEKTRHIAVVPLGSAVDQLATVNSLDVGLRQAAKAAGVRQVERVPQVSADPGFAAGLATIVKEHLEKQAALGLGF